MKKAYKDQLTSLIPKFSGQKVTVIGDVGLDRYTDCDAMRLSPETPVPVLKPMRIWSKLGLAANVAENILTLGGDPYLVSVVGMDQVEFDFMHHVDEMKMRCYIRMDDKRKTTCKHRILSGIHQFCRIDEEVTDPINMVYWDALLHAVNKNDAPVIVQDYGKGIITQEIYLRLVEWCKSKGYPIIVDPHPSNPLSFYEMATILAPNRVEAEAFTGIKITDEASMERASSYILRKTAHVCIIKMGSKGLWLHDKRSKPLLIPARAKTIYDVSGAGDTVIAAISLALMSGATLLEACIFGNAAASVVVGKTGTATVNQTELTDAISCRQE